MKRLLPLALALVALAGCREYKGKTSRSAAEWQPLLERAITGRSLELAQCMKHLPAGTDRAEVQVEIHENQFFSGESEIYLKAYKAVEPNSENRLSALESCTYAALHEIALPSEDDSHYVELKWTIVYDRNAKLEVIPRG